MRKYKVVFVRQELVDLRHRTDRRDLREEYHLVKARNAKMAIKEAKSRAIWINKQLPSSQRVELREVYNSRGKRIWWYMINRW